MTTELPLVSIIVITYNSSEFVLETLESAKAQTYENIELIISDDCSTDNTVEICTNWLTENKDRFVNSRLITVEQNRGIPANCNRGIKASNGEWIKLIAGDDCLQFNSIELFVETCKNRKEIEIIAGKMQRFNTKLLETTPSKKEQKFFSYSADKQYRWLLKRSFNFSPAAFIKKKLITDLGYFDEEFRFFEDLPMWLKICKSGVQIHFLDEIVVNYRVGENSMINNRTNIFNELFMSSYFDFRKKYIYKNIPFYDFIFYQSELIELINYKIMINIFRNKRSPASAKITSLLFLFSSKRYWFFLKNRFVK